MYSKTWVNIFQIRIIEPQTVKRSRKAIGKQVVDVMDIPYELSVQSVKHAVHIFGVYNGNN